MGRPHNYAFTLFVSDKYPTRNIQGELFWVVTMCKVAVGYQCFEYGGS